MIKSYEQFLTLFAEKPRNRAGNGVLVICPAHKDKRPSLWIQPAKNPDFIATWDCKAGCTRENVLKAVNLNWIDVTRNSNGKVMSVTHGKARRCVDDTAIQNQITVDTQPLTDGDGDHNGRAGSGITLAKIAEIKKLEAEFLKSLGINDFRYMGLPAVKIPYYSEVGQEVAVRYRVGLYGDRFRWRKGDHLAPYGLQYLERIRNAGWVLVVEGESDCWTAWHYDLPVLGAPGKNNWPLAWGDYLKGLAVFVWQEPNSEDFTMRVLASSPDLRFIVAPEEVKDISEAHIQGIPLVEWLEELKSKAEYGRELKSRAANQQIKAAYEAATAVINAEDPLELVNDAIQALGYGGDTKPVILTYLAATSRLLEMRPGAMPVHQLLIGPPSAGKSYTVTVVLSILPSEAYHIIDAGSPRALIYSDADLQHRVVIFSEADSLPAGEDNPAASAIRNLLQDHHLHYTVTVRDPVTGNFTVKEVDKLGPTVLITTSTKSLGQQLMTRVFTLEVSDSETQIKAALEAQATLEIEGVGEPDSSLIAYQRFLQLQAPFRVIVPYARELAKMIGTSKAAPRILRDFARLMSLIKSVALLRYRKRLINSNGQIVATIEDYRVVRELVKEMYINTTTGITPEVRQIVNKINELDSTRIMGGKITNVTLGRDLNMTDKRTKRLAEKAIRMGWIVNREQRKKYPADYGPGEPMPEVDGLPLPETLMVSTPVEAPQSPESEAEDEVVDMSTLDTGGSLASDEMAGHKSGKWEVEI